jgi:hypothetical protein
MRTITGPERTLLGASQLNFHAKLEMEDSEGNFVDVANLGGYDWFVGAMWNEGIDEPVMSGSIALAREHDDATSNVISLAPLMVASVLNRDSGALYAPFIDVARRFRLFIAVTSPGVAPVSGDWKKIMSGKIDRISLATNPITLTFRDEGAWLQIAQIREERIYGSIAGTAVETVMQEIIDDNPPRFPVVLVTPVSPGWFIHRYQQSMGNVFDAIRALAHQIGWEVRYRWNSSGNLELRFYEPNRSTAIVDTSFGPDEYLEVRDMSLSDADTRNRIRGWYYDAASGALAFEEVSHAGSMILFGARDMEFAEDRTSNIDSATEMLSMVTAALNDLAYPFADQEIETLLFWPAETGDVYTFLANGVHYDQDQTWGVVQLRHVVERNRARTNIVTRGQPAGLYKTWIDMAGTGARNVSGIPNPMVIVVGGESTQQDGTVVGLYKGAVHIEVTTDPYMERLEIYGSMSLTPNQPIVELSNNRLCGILRRQDGDYASALRWTTQVQVDTLENAYRKLFILPFNSRGERGPATTVEIRALDAGDAPTAPPSGLAIVVQNSATPGRSDNSVTWTNGDTTAQTRVWRNGIIIAIIAPNIATFADTGVSTGTQYTYDVQHIKNAQTSAFAGSPPPLTGGGSSATQAPIWASGFPRPHPVDPRFIQLAWSVSDGSATHVELEYSLFADRSFTPITGPNFGGGGYPLAQFPTNVLPTGPIEDNSFPVGTQFYFRIKSIRGINPPLYSETRAVIYGGDSAAFTRYRLPGGGFGFR